MWCLGVGPGRRMPLPGQCVAPVGLQDPTGYGRVSAQRTDFRVTSALPEPDSLLTARIGPPSAYTRANPLTSRPAPRTVTDRLAATSGRIPAMTNASVPIAKDPRARTHRKRRTWP